MNKLLYTLLLLICSIAASAQVDSDNLPDKGTGFLYFSGTMGTYTPTISATSEVAINTLTRDIYQWDRTNNKWVRSIMIDQDSGTPVGTPGVDGPFLHIDTDNGDLYQWTGTAWAKMDSVIYGEYENDVDAAANGVPLGGKYTMSESNTLGSSPGDLRTRKY